ncbi:MAG: Alpha-1,4-N-acetylgalactosamine transferase PglJ (EC [uncultured Sulfurovum sp.]|uniref:Alpha-1,4-N-acetylgalactosamine transferase PglJ (EC) n=1 Tax=uncultured Sulfurovum sp. TaxID=269237 RepID=A0A6S6T3M3_9BACT|nr:MAG: Alpha-1,4-N-acetylgalactosamine transferase PglJ (EC [uncultured Sulfurovum sp.]
MLSKEKSKPTLSILIYSLAGGGAERVVSILLQELKDKYDITLVLMRDKIDYEIPQSIKIHFLENSQPDEHGILKLLKLPVLGWKYKKFCQENNIEVSLAFMNRPSYVSIFAKLFGNKAFTTISERTTPSMMYRADNLVSKISKYLIKKLYPKADFIVCNAEGNRQDLTENFGIPLALTSTIHNPFDLAKIEKLSEEPVEGIDFNKFTFVSVGRLDTGKNHTMMIDAFAKIENKNVQLIILGEGGLKVTLEEQIRFLNLEKRVFLLGFDSNPYKYFSKSDCFVFSSSYEGFPNVLVEALACALPIISTDCKSGPREILAPSSKIAFQLKDKNEVAEYGILIPINNTNKLKEMMNLMLKDIELRENYRQRAKKRAKSFDKALIVDAYIDVLERSRL